MRKGTRGLMLGIYVLALSVNVNGQTLAMRAPELFGDAQAVLVRSDGSLGGLIYAPGALFAFEGSIGTKDVTCTITQIGGAPIDGAERPVHCYAAIRAGKWIGWIDFRGSRRKFCAAAEVGALPASCRLGP